MPSPYYPFMSFFFPSRAKEAKKKKKKTPDLRLDMTCYYSLRSMTVLSGATERRSPNLLAVSLPSPAYNLARPAKTAILRRLTWLQPSCFFLFTLLPWFHHFLILLVFYRNLPHVFLKDMRSYVLSKNTVFHAVGEKRYRCFSSLYGFHSAETWLSLRRSLWYF